MAEISSACPPYAVFFGFAGAGSSMIFSSEYAVLCSSCTVRTARTAIGAAYGTWKAGIGIAGAGTIRPDIVMKVSSRLASALSSDFA